MRVIVLMLLLMLLPKTGNFFLTEEVVLLPQMGPEMRYSSSCLDRPVRNVAENLLRSHLLQESRPTRMHQKSASVSG